ncbi:transmembrane protein 176B-like isoform X1 [Pleurodeles waltl]|uniref:transmembrane protein 176B-like isoform X1 n=2 Tax=Pleurodeles waltl TaxID=8319 RepID=UPI003709B9E9
MERRICPGRRDVLQVGTMSSNIIRVNGVEVASEASKPTVINININQPSGVTSMLESAKTAWNGQKILSENASKTPATRIRGEQKVLGAVQIMSGLVCISLAVMFCLIQEGILFYTGSGFWTGIPFILAGAVSIIAEKRAGPCWLYVAWLMNLASLAVAIAGIVIIANDFIRFPWYRWSAFYFCKRESNVYSDDYAPTGPQSRDWQMEQCMDMFSNFMYVLSGMKVMLLVATSLTICIALWSLGYGCKTLCCKLASQQEEDEVADGSKEPLAASQPLSPEKLQKVETV